MYFIAYIVGLKMYIFYIGLLARRMMGKSFAELYVDFIRKREKERKTERLLSITERRRSENTC